MALYEAGQAVSTLDCLPDTGGKRHIVVGDLRRIAALFGGRAFTVMTIKNEEEKE